MTDILRYLIEKYPAHATNIKYLPLKGCDRCGGNGEYETKGVGWSVCICTCVKGWNNDLSEIVRKAARKAREEMEQEIALAAPREEGE